MELSELKEKAVALLRANHREKDGFEYTVPSPISYPYQWFWDSCFHAIIFAHIDIAQAKKEMRSLVAKQFENGMIPHMIYWQLPEGKGPKPIEVAWGKDGTSSITQPPMLAYAAWHIFEKDQDLSFLESLYPALYHFYQYLLHERDPHERHLIGIINPDESGEDDSPRFDKMLDLPPVHDLDENFKRRLKLVEENRTCNFDAPFCMKNFFWVKDVPFNTIMVENLRFLARIAEKLGHTYDASFFDMEASRTAKAMRELMLEDGIFWSTYGEHYEKIKVKTWAIFAPLFAKIYTQEEAQTVVEHYLRNEKEFATPYPVPTVSKSEASYNASGFWRGPVWISTNWFIYRGLINYGFVEDAEHIRSTSLTLLEKGGFREHFNPETGEAQGAENFTWGALVIDMFESKGT